MNASNSDTQPHRLGGPKPQSGGGRTAPLALWRVAEAFMHILFALFGTPGDVAARHTLRFNAHKQMASWLRCAEAMMRRLLLIEAAAYAKPNTRPLLHEPRRRTRKLMGFSPEHPEKWRVSFRCFMERGRPRPHTLSDGETRARTPALRFRSAWPLAERYEALLRVFNDPTAYARRLSRRLHATPHRAHEFLRAPPEAPNRVDQWRALKEAAGGAHAAFNSS